jgi:hypothetical protein
LDRFTLDPLNGANATEDPDGDGVSNLGEYNAGTDPHVAPAPPPPPQPPTNNSGGGGGSFGPLLILGLPGLSPFAPDKALTM